MALSPASIRLVGVSGSLRRDSFNTALLRAVARDLPDGVEMSILDLADLPLYDGDLEARVGFPPPVGRLREAVAEADGLLLASPEYNFSVTGVLKNAIDWLSRGPGSPLDRRPAAIIGAGGGSGTARSQRHLREILSHNRVHVVAEPDVLVVKRATRFVDGELADPHVEARLRELLGRLIGVIERERHSPSPHLDGNVLVVGTGPPIDRLRRHLAEHGHRTLQVLDVAEVPEVLARRRIAAIVMMDPTDLGDIDPTLPHLVPMEPNEPELTVAALHEALRSGTTVR